MKRGQERLVEQEEKSSPQNSPANNCYLLWSINSDYFWPGKKLKKMLSPNQNAAHYQGPLSLLEAVHWSPVLRFPPPPTHTWICGRADPGPAAFLCSVWRGHLDFDSGFSGFPWLQLGSNLNSCPELPNCFQLDPALTFFILCFQSCQSFPRSGFLPTTYCL